jgi:hypothetical protein
MAKPGKMANHHAETSLLEADNKLPHVTSSGATPIPKNERLDSVRIAPATPKAIVINTEVKEFGIACLKLLLLRLTLKLVPLQ